MISGGHFAAAVFNGNLHFPLIDGHSVLFSVSYFNDSQGKPSNVFQ